MDAYFQSTLAANSLQPPKTTSSTTPNTTRVIAHFPPTNKDFNCTELHTPDGTYSLLHETFFDTIAPQFATGTRAYVVGVVKEDHVPLDSSEDEGLTFSSVGSLSMTPVVKSAALPIPNARRTLRTTSSSSSSIGNLHILTSPQKIMTANNGPGSPYLPNSPSFMPSTPTQQQQPQQELVNYDSLSSSLTNPVAIANGGSVGSLSSLFGRGNNLYSSNSIGAGVGKSTPQLSSSIARTMSSTNSRPKNHLSKTNSTFVLRFVVHENLQKYLASRAIDDEFLFFNIGSSFIWVDAKTKSKDPLSRIVFSKSYPLCHDINETTRCDDHLDIIIGFSTGDIVWYDPFNSKYVRLNKAGCLVNAAVSMIRWIPGSDDLFVATFKNGCVMIMDKERDDQSFSIPEPTTWVESQFTALRPHKSSKYNPVSCWKISTKGLTDFAFSPDGVHLAVTGVDGQLRVIDFRNERLLDVYSSYYGKLNCVDWSPDGRYILTGGEDDLVTLWSFLEKKMVARCQGHKSWVTGVAFDRWKCDEQTYRFASVGEDCNLIFWDFSYSALQKPKHPRVVASSPTSPTSKKSPILQSSSSPPPPPPPAPQPIPPTPAPLAPLLVERKKSLKTHRLFRGFSSPDTSTILSSSSTSSNSSSTVGSSFSRFRKRSSRSHNLFSNSSSNTDFTAAPVEDTVEEQWKQQHLPVLHPPLKKNQAAILQPTTIRAIHADPCLSVTFRQDTIVTTDRRGRIRTWGRP